MHEKQFNIPAVRPPLSTWRLCCRWACQWHYHSLASGTCLNYRVGLWTLQQCGMALVTEQRCGVQVQNRTLKFGGGVLGLVVVGFGIPFFAAWWQIKKAAG